MNESNKKFLILTIDFLIGMIAALAKMKSTISEDIHLVKAGKFIVKAKEKIEKIEINAGAKL